MNIPKSIQLLALPLLLTATVNAQNLIFVSNDGANTVGEYTDSGATVNASLITGLNFPAGLAISGTNLFVANGESGTIGEYTTSGGTINATLISGLTSPTGIAVVPAGPPPSVAITTVSNQPVVIWPGSANGFVLQMTTNLASGNWVTVTGGVPFTGLQITNAPSPAFFRLSQP